MKLATALSLVLAAGTAGKAQAQTTYNGYFGGLFDGPQIFELTVSLPDGTRDAVNTNQPLGSLDQYMSVSRLRQISIDLLPKTRSSDTLLTRVSNIQVSGVTQSLIDNSFLRNPADAVSDAIMDNNICPDQVQFSVDSGPNLEIDCTLTWTFPKPCQSTNSIQYAKGGGTQQPVLAYLLGDATAGEVQGDTEACVNLINQIRSAFNTTGADVRIENGQANQPSSLLVGNINESIPGDAASVQVMSLVTLLLAQFLLFF